MSRRVLNRRKHEAAQKAKEARASIGVRKAAKKTTRKKKVKSNEQHTSTDANANTRRLA